MTVKKGSKLLTKLIASTNTQGAFDRASANDQELLTQAELAKRLGCDSGTLTKNRSKPSFKEWSQSKDPEGKAWRYLPDSQRYGLVEAQKSSWEA
jgi:hypothetical protein